MADPTSPIPDIRPAWETKADLIDFTYIVFEEQTGVNYAQWYQDTCTNAGLTPSAILNAAPDGAGNCVAALSIIKEWSLTTSPGHPIEDTKCYAHKLARVTLVALGLHGNEANSRNPELRLFVLRIKKLALILSISPKKKHLLVMAQKELGVTELTAKNQCITRWKAISQNSRSLVLIEVELKSAFSSHGQITVPIFNDDGELMGDETKAIDAAELLFGGRESLENRQLSAVLKPIEDLTDKIQGIVASRGDEFWCCIIRLHNFSKMKIRFIRSHKKLRLSTKSA